MNKFDRFKNKNIDELVDWLDKYAQFDTAPWWKWWDKTYCSRCEPVIQNKYSADYGDEAEKECAWCELNEKCIYFQDKDEMPSHKETIKMWLETEDNEDEEEHEKITYRI